jgi:hypothetical protein
MRFRNPQTGYVEDFGETVWPQVLLLGPLFFAGKGMWGHAILAGVAAFLSGMITWFFVYPFAAKMVIRSHYAKKGWTDVTDIPPDNLKAGTRDSDVRIVPGSPEGSYRPLSEVAVKLIRFSPAEKMYTKEDADFQLKEKAWLLGGNAVVNVQYEQTSATIGTAGHLAAKGLAIIDESLPVARPVSDEGAKPETTICKHCGSELPQVP